MTTIARLVGSFPRLEKVDHGLDPVFYYLSKEQTKLGLKIHIFTPGAGKIPIVEYYKSLVVHRIPFPFNINVIKGLLNLKSNEGLDIIHSHATRGYSTVFLKKKLSTPIIGQIHGTSFSLKERSNEGSFLSQRDKFRTMAQFWPTILRQKSMWSRLDRIFAVSKSISNSLINYYSIKQKTIRVLYNAVDPNQFTPQSRETIHKLRNHLSIGDGPILLFVGSFRPIKGIHFLLAAMKNIVSDFPNVNLVLIGGIPQFMHSQASYYTYLRRYIIELGISESVRFLNKVPHIFLPVLYSMADILLMPSLYESFGKVAVEAMACETPVIASDVGGLPEIIDNGVNGLLVNVGSVKMISQSVNDLLNNNSKANQIGKRGRIKVMNNFTWQIIAKKSLQYYEELLTQKNRNK